MYRHGYGKRTGRAVTRRFDLLFQDVEANTVRLEEHGKTVLVLEKSSDRAEQPGAGNSSK